MWLRARLIHRRRRCMYLRPYACRHMPAAGQPVPDSALTGRTGPDGGPDTRCPCLLPQTPYMARRCTARCCRARLLPQPIPGVTGGRRAAALRVSRRATWPGSVRSARRSAHRSRPGGSAGCAAAARAKGGPWPQPRGRAPHRTASCASKPAATAVPLRPRKAPCFRPVPEREKAYAGRSGTGSAPVPPRAPSTRSSSPPAPRGGRRKDSPGRARSASPVP